MDFQVGEILLIDKPLTWTSFDVVNKLRWNICKKLKVKKLKVGHAGTLDPMATGVMIVCTGKKTKEIDLLQAQTKEYIATLFLGATTPSFDREMVIDAVFPTEHITRELVEQTLDQFKGEIWQVPPTYSAVKVDGKRAYDYARKGQEVEIKAKQLVIDEIELIDYKDTDTTEYVDKEGAKKAQPAGVEVSIRVVCSKGTYIRALARDIGKALNSGAYLTSLRRTRVGDFRVDHCETIESFLDRLSKEEYISND